MNYRLNFCVEVKTNIYKIRISQDNPITIIECDIFSEEDLTLKSDVEKINIVLEEFYRKNYLNRAENEAIGNLKDELNTFKNDFITETELMKSELKKDVEKAMNALQLITSVINELLDPDEEDEEENMDNGGDEGINENPEVDDENINESTEHEEGGKRSDG